MSVRVVVLFHLLGMAAFLGAAFAQQRLMAISMRAGLAPAARDDYERLVAAIITKIEIPALFAQILTGIVFIAQDPLYMKRGWLHGKLACVVVLLVLSHLEMFNARRLVRARAERGDAANVEIVARKNKHAGMGTVALLLIIAVLVLGVLQPTT